MQNQVTELSSEKARMSQAFEAQKKVTADAESVFRKKMDELNKELSAHVGAVLTKFI